jgi:hypothetical protein
MRIIFGVLSLLVVVAIIGVLAKKQLNPGAPRSASSASEPGTVAPLAGTPQQQVQQYKQAVQGAINQQPRQIPEDSTK